MGWGAELSLHMVMSPAYPWSCGGTERSLHSEDTMEPRLMAKPLCVLRATMAFHWGTERVSVLFQGTGHRAQGKETRPLSHLPA